MNWIGSWRGTVGTEVLNPRIFIRDHNTKLHDRPLSWALWSPFVGHYLTRRCDEIPFTLIQVECYIEGHSNTNIASQVEWACTFSTLRNF